jgi:threonine/homoserine/homoserine lactone efflux protein
MPGVHDLWLFVAAGLLLNLTPGPDMAYIAARAAAGGFRAGAAATFGITAGCIVHTLAAATGLSLLLATSAAAFTIVKWCGAAYLAYAGVRLLVAASRPPLVAASTVDAPRPARLRRIFREALVINVFNPKVALFFLAFLPQFIDASASSPALAFVFLGTLFNVDSLFVNLPVAWLASEAARRGRASERVSRALHGAAGALFVVLAVRLAAFERH